jgi:general secretion pathway protein C
MRLRSLSRADRLIGRLPRFTVYSAGELLLLALIAVQVARLAWTLVTPVGPVGEYKGAAPLAPPGVTALAEFDPFFRLSAGGAPAVVTALNLRLYGVREDRATGRGSAIIALPDGNQSSFGVGEEIMPGVTLTEVAFDSVTISRNGAPEQIFLDQSEPAAPAATVPGAPAAIPAPAPMQAAPPAPAPVVSIAAPPIRFQPRMNDGRVDGIIVSPGGDGGQAFRAAGFAPGDVIVSVNGQRVGSTEQARALIRGSGGQATVVVDRAGRQVPIILRLEL